MIDNVYYINLNSSINRKNLIENNLSKIFLKFKRFPAINGHNINNNIIYSLHKKKLLKYNLPIQKKGRLGTYLSHYYLLKSIFLNENIKSKILIIEDDVIIPSDFMLKYNYYLKFCPTDFDILLVGHTDKLYGVKINKYILKPFNINNINTNNGLFAYIINVKSIPKILNLLTPINNEFKSEVNAEFNIKHIDWVLRSFFSNKLNAYYTIDNLIFHNNNLQSDRKTIDIS